MEVWEPKSEVRDPVSKVWESACGVWELKGKVWDLSSHQLPLNLTPDYKRYKHSNYACIFYNGDTWYIIIMYVSTKGFISDG